MKNITLIAILTAATITGCGGKKKALGDKGAACDNIYTTYSSHQDKKVWKDACMAAPDETVRCVNLIMDEGKDDDCKKAVNSPERTKLVQLINGKPDAPPAGGDMAGGGSAAPAGGGGGGGDLPAECNDYKAAIEALAKCDKLPQATRDALKQSYEQTSAAWAQVPAEGRAALGTACKSAADAVKQSAAACN